MAPGKGGARIVALNRAACHSGLGVGDLLSNARSKVLALQARDADPASDAAALHRLALWALRYTPVVAAWDEASGANGLFLDITGCAHLFGGEERLLADLRARLHGFGLAPRLAIANTAGTAWAVAHYGHTDRMIVRSGDEAKALGDLPMAALRLSGNAQSLMRRLGFRRIGEIMNQPRAPFAARFDGHVLLRLDQAMGRAPEPLLPVVPPAVHRAQAMFVEPIMSTENVLVAARRLLVTLSQDLAVDDAGARVVRLLLFRVDGDVLPLDLGLAAPSRDPDHIVRLIALRLERLEHDLETGFGFEAAAIHVLVAETLTERQTGLSMSEDDASPDGLARLVNRLQQRLGHGAVRQLHPYQSHSPGRAEQVRSATPTPPRPEALSDQAASNAPAALRPLLLLPKPEEVQVVALIPDGPPRQFRWRGITHHVADAEGPERITPEWWRRTDDEERDYYVVEDVAGRLFWLYRHGLYGNRAASPQWFVHGVFP